MASANVSEAICGSVWYYFNTLRNTTIQCKICQKIYPKRVEQNINILIRHLFKHEINIAVDQMPPWLLQHFSGDYKAICKHCFEVISYTLDIASLKAHIERYHPNKLLMDHA